MADPRSTPAAVHDGRFGERFDDEIPAGKVVVLAAVIAFVCALGMLVTWGLLSRSESRVEALAPPPSPVAEANERRLPSGPRLQADPEAELAALRAEMAVELHEWGWVDEGRGIVRIPIEVAIDLLVARAESEGSGGSGGSDRSDTSGVGTETADEEAAAR